MVGGGGSKDFGVVLIWVFEVGTGHQLRVEGWLQNSKGGGASEVLPVEKSRGGERMEKVVAILKGGEGLKRFGDSFDMVV